MIVRDKDIKYNHLTQKSSLVTRSKNENKKPEEQSTGLLFLMLK